MTSFSVKKPFTVFVAVVAILVFGVMSYVKMTPDLMPNMDYPYVVVVTTYPGAAPEEVEAVVTKPMEQSMATLNDIKTVTSTSAENYSMLVLEFEQSTNMDRWTFCRKRRCSPAAGTIPSARRASSASTRT